MKVSFGGRNTPIRKESWQSLLHAANIDFVSVLILWYSGVYPQSTYAWMFPHTLEKYFKSYLLKSKKLSSRDVKKLGHDVLKIWENFKKISKVSTGKPSLNRAFDKIIKDFSTIADPRVRYSNSVDWSSDGLIYFYITLSSFIRYLIVEKKTYRSTFYGLEDSIFYLSTIGEPYGKQIVHKMLHLSLEHGMTFTNLGFINPVNLKNLSISNTAIGEKLDDCPICKKLGDNSINLNQQTLTKFYRDLSVNSQK